MEARFLNDEKIRFIERNVKNFPGKSTLKFNISEPKSNFKISMYTLDNGFEMNDEMAVFLEGSPEMEVQVVTV
jgi:DNA polymerase-3 subunit alpha